MGKQWAGAGDEAVKQSTGKTWQQWFDLLNNAGAVKMSHREIVDYLKTNFDLSPWWQQNVTVGYEQSQGLREKHQRPDGFEISRSKTINAPVDKLFALWKDGILRGSWLKEPGISITTENVNKNLRFRWVDGETTGEARFTEKGEEKTQVTVQHFKLKDGRMAAQMKEFWAANLNNLKKTAEGNQPL
ncbi:MAG: DUF4287 domain-containing protein [Calditrichia bacterium]